MDRYTVLLVDDDSALLKMGEELLSGSYDVSIARSGMQALRLLETGFAPDIILLDINMPDMNGYQTLERLRKTKAAADVPVIFLTGVSDSWSEVRGLSLGAIDYITKPFIKEVLLARVKVHIEDGRKRRQAMGTQANPFDLNIDEGRFNEFAAMLTGTERKIARLILLGMSNQEICNELHYSYAYVKKVAATILEKAGVNKRGDLRGMFTINR